MNERRGLAVMLGPYLVGIVALIVVPALVTFGLSLFEYDLIRSPEWIGLDNFRELNNDPVFETALRNSLGYIASAVPLRLLGALTFALLLHRRFRGVGAARTAAYLPTVVPDAAYAVLWLWLLNPLYGPINSLLDSLGVVSPSWLTEPDAARWAVVLMSVFQVGEGFLVAMVTRQALPQSLYDMAGMEGAGPWQTFRRVTLPLMAPTLILLMFRDTAFSLQANFVPALLVTEGGPPPYATTYLPVFVYQEAFGYLRYGYAASATLVMFVVTAVIVAAQYVVVRRWRRSFVL
ncbi:MAG TPA: sugar ABC transporter permease [Acidimicrobiales bacterium]|nr:sugar ABC transporter permease [Acidimicrobiales bacterium]